MKTLGYRHPYIGVALWPALGEDCQECRIKKYVSADIGTLPPRGDFGVTNDFRLWIIKSRL
ncbi:MAG: hypothetical protein IMF26_02725 [Candidatus Fermentithermobacillus carboniphilus]|uniref:Uncharacterized protein n=1 Tax=Candidatus Fermentithermobacillus carboniphilus TaxID=3085328 RepID=A0AAT9LD42_9FIRM|nr:MAG: hypothetical protein IMF26_02725 [Candidatus Fermentithermobacillus carboniphilus]